MKVIGLVGVKESGKTTSFEMIKEQYNNVVELQLAGKLKDTCSELFNIPRNHLDDQSLKEVPFETPRKITYENLIEIEQIYQIPNRERIEYLELRRDYLLFWCLGIFGLSLTVIRQEQLYQNSFTLIFLGVAVLAFAILIGISHTAIVKVHKKLSRRQKHVGTELKSPRHAAQYIGTQVLRDYDADIHCKEAFKIVKKQQTLNPDKDFLFVVTDMRFPNEVTFFSKIESYKGAIGIYRTTKMDSLKQEIAEGKAHPSESEVLKTIESSEIVYNDGSIEHLKEKLNEKLTSLLG